MLNLGSEVSCSQCSESFLTKVHSMNVVGVFLGGGSSDLYPCLPEGRLVGGELLGGFLLGGGSSDLDPWLPEDGLVGGGLLGGIFFGGGSSAVVE